MQPFTRIFLISILSSLYPFWAWHEIFTFVALSNWSVFQFGLSNLWNICPNGWNGHIPKSNFGLFSIQSVFGLIGPNRWNGQIPKSYFGLFSIQSVFGLIGPNRWNGQISKSVIWTLFFSPNSDWSVQMVIQWDRSKRIRLLKLEVR